MLSFVIQGKFYPEWTVRLLQSIRQFFPGAEIILSCYDEEVDPTLYDKRVVNELLPPSPWNINLQLNTSFSGILEASHKIVVKLRSDLLVVSNNLLSILDILDWPSFNNKQVFDKKIGVCNLYTHRDIPGFLSDHVYIGTKKDLTKLFAIPKYDEIRKGCHIYHQGLGPEQYIACMYLKLCYPDLVFNNLEDSLPYMVDNFVVFNTTSQLGIIPQKSTLKETDSFVYRHDDWLQFYSKYRKSE